MTAIGSNIRYFNSIPPLPRKEMIVTRLGHSKSMTVLGDEEISFLEKGINKGLSLCRPAGVFGRFGIAYNDGEQVMLENGHGFISKSLSKLLKDSAEVVLMAATVGGEVVSEVERQMKEGDAALGVILDSTASQTADASVVWIMDFVDKLVKREGKKVTKHRYSPGFGDLALDNQRIIFDLLDLSKLELSLTERYMLIPEKSVTAIAGIEECRVL